MDESTGWVEEPTDWEWVAAFGARVAAVRGLARLTVRELSEISGVPEERIAAVEAGRYDMDPWEGLSIADAMGVTFDFLLDVRDDGRAFERYSRVRGGIVRGREPRVPSAPVYRADNLPAEIVERARPAFAG